MALKKVGLNSKSFDFSGGGSTDSKSKSGSNAGLDDVEAENTNGGWPAWMSMKSLPITVAPWFSPPPPPVPVADPPKIGDLAPLDRDRKLEFGRGRPVLVVFLRCVGCACTSDLSFTALTQTLPFPYATCIFAPVTYICSPTNTPFLLG